MYFHTLSPLPEILRSWDVCKNIPLHEKRNAIFWQNLTHINTEEYESEVDASGADWE